MFFSASFYQYVLSKIYEHLQITFTSLFLASILAIPLGSILAKSTNAFFANVILRIVAAIQTVPGLALIALTTAMLVLLRSYILVPTVGFLPGTLVLSIYAILPMMNSTYSGIRGIDPSLLEVARGMGMTRMQMFSMIEFPLALPAILMGFRVSLVWTFGSATLTSLIGSGGLGDLILQGLRTMNVPIICFGTIPLMILAIFFDGLVAHFGPKLLKGPSYKTTENS